MSEGKNLPDLNLEDLLTQFPRALMRANAELEMAYALEPGLVQSPVVYQIPKMEVEIRISLTSRTGGIVALFADAKSEEKTSTVKLELCAVPRGNVEAFRTLELKRNGPTMKGLDVKRVQLAIQSFLARLNDTQKAAVMQAAITRYLTYPNRLASISTAKSLQGSVESPGFVDEEFGPATAEVIRAIKEQILGTASADEKVDFKTLQALVA